MTTCDNDKPYTRRCVYCRPRWTWGVRRWSLLGRLYALIWPPHVIGPDYGPPYTDGACTKAEEKLNADAKTEELESHVIAGPYSQEKTLFEYGLKNKEVKYWAERYRIKKENQK